jgi:hypothetical protein
LFFAAVLVLMAGDVERQTVMERLLPALTEPAAAAAAAGGFLTVTLEMAGRAS